MRSSILIDDQMVITSFNPNRIEQPTPVLQETTASDPSNSISHRVASVANDCLSQVCNQPTIAAPRKRGRQKKARLENRPQPAYILPRPEFNPIIAAQSLPVLQEQTSSDPSIFTSRRVAGVASESLSKADYLKKHRKEHEEEDVMAKKKHRQAQQKEYRKANEEKIAAQKKIHYLANRPEIIARMRQYRRDHKDQIVASRKCRPAKKARLENTQLAYILPRPEFNPIITETQPVSQEKTSLDPSRSISSRVAGIANGSLSQIEQREREYQKGHRQPHQPEIAAKRKEYYLCNREERIAYQKQYRKAKKARLENTQPELSQVQENGVDPQSIDDIDDAIFLLFNHAAQSPSQKDEQM